MAASRRPWEIKRSEHELQLSGVMADFYGQPLAFPSVDKSYFYNK